MRKEYIDIHCHMLPGVDDGSSDIETTIQMLGISYEEGVRGIILTPHYEVGRNLYEPDQLDSILDQVKGRAREAYPELQLYLGNEVLQSQGVVECLRNGSVHTMNATKYVLVEFNIQISYHELYQAMKDMVQARFRPIIAHVERYRCLVKNMDRIRELQELGIYLQMNAESVLGSPFDENVRWCRKLMKEHKISFLGSDAHDMQERAPHMRESIEWMYKKLEEKYVDAVVYGNPALMLENKYI